MTLLGQGNFSKVFRVCSKFDGLEYAIKRSFRVVTSEVEAKQWQQACNGVPLCFIMPLYAPKPLWTC